MKCSYKMTNDLVVVNAMYAMALGMMHNRFKVTGKWLLYFWSQKCTITCLTHVHMWAAVNTTKLTTLICTNQDYITWEHTAKEAVPSYTSLTCSRTAPSSHRFLFFAFSSSESQFSGSGADVYQVKERQGIQ